MKVLFLKEIANVAKYGEVKEVASGYARNFLLPKGYAALATSERIEVLEHRTQAKEAREKAKTKRLRDVFKKIEHMKFKIRVHTNKEGKLYAGLSQRAIAKEFLAKKYSIPEQHLRLPRPIKSVGEHKVLVVSGAETLGQITLEVVGEVNE
jgi:large subunit ribosomal protein L9